MAGRILVIETKPGLAAKIGGLLVAHGYQSEGIPYGPEAERKALDGSFDLIIADKEASDSLVKDYPIPILVIASPLEDNILLDRVRNLINGTQVNSDEDRSAPLDIDLEKGSIVFPDHECVLSAQEIKLLDYLLLHRDTVVSRQELLSTVWGYDSNITTRTIDVHVARLRHKLGDLRDIPRYIHTVRGVGYKFTPPRK
jgi:DNA-binding response OmpR family regulator